MPEPSRLVLLEQLPTLSSGTKIRLLGCVHAHYAADARIVLRDRYPTTADSTPTAVVDIDNILQDINQDLLQVGSWVNVIGYVRVSQVNGSRKSKSFKDVVRPKEAGQSIVVDATMMWSAGAIKLDKYKSAAQQYQKLPSVS